MKALLHHDIPEALMAASRRRGRGRVAHRLLAIRDVMLERSRRWVCAQYGISRENLRHWVAWYNDHAKTARASGPDVVMRALGIFVPEATARHHPRDPSLRTHSQA
jgi:hypothetical protein